MKDKVLRQLLELRKRHERRALEILTVQTAALRNAQMAAQHARQAALDYETSAQIIEDQLFSNVIGKTVSNIALVQLRTAQEDMDFHVDILTNAVHEADEFVEKKQEDMVEAQKQYQIRQRAVVKLEGFVKKQNLVQQRRQDSLSDLD